MKRALTILVTGPILFSFWPPGPRRVSAQTGGYLVQPYGANLDTWSGLAPSTYFQAGVTDANAAVEDIRKCAGLYNVRKYGAYADGTHDDTAAIQRAINTASAAHSIVYFPAGTYKVTTSLNCPAYTQIVGSSLYHINRTSGVEPYGTTLLFQPTSEATLFTLTGAKTAGYRQDIAFHNFYIRGNTAGPKIGRAHV
jgi:hypothetical protein